MTIASRMFVMALLASLPLSIHAQNALDQLEIDLSRQRSITESMTFMVDQMQILATLPANVVDILLDSTLSSQERIASAVRALYNSQQFEPPISTPIQADPDPQVVTPLPNHVLLAVPQLAATDIVSIEAPALGVTGQVIFALNGRYYAATPGQAFVINQPGYQYRQFTVHSIRELPDTDIEVILIAGNNDPVRLLYRAG